MDEGVSRATFFAVLDHVRGSTRDAESWRDAGLCRWHDPNFFFPVGRGQAAAEQTETAKGFCLLCPSREPCLAFAVATQQELGVWGGTSPEERRPLFRRGRRRRVAS